MKYSFQTNFSYDITNMNLLSFETFFNQRHIMKDNVNFDLDTTNAATRKFRVINVHLRLSDWVSMLGGERLIGQILKVPMPSPKSR